MSMINGEILELCSLIRFFKINEKKIDTISWELTVHLAYETKNLIDLFEVLPGDSDLISTLVEIIEKVRDIKDSLSVENFLEGEDGSVKEVPSAKDGSVGFIDEREKIIELLLGPSLQREVISIVGMAGGGKTTLAKNLYNNFSQVHHHFDVRAWWSATQVYKRREMLLGILGQIAPNLDHNNLLDDEDLADKLCQVLRKRRYLIVIDDMWDAQIWSDLKKYFPDDRTQSRILITTRSEDVALKMNSKVIALGGVTLGESWANLVSLSQPEIDLFNMLRIRELPKLQKMSCVLFHRCPRTELLPYELDTSCRNCADMLEPDMFLFGFSDHLTSLKVEYKHRPNNGIQNRTVCFLPNLPTTLEKLTLVTCPLSSNDMSRIGSLPSLEVLKLYGWDQFLRGSDNFNVTDELFLSLRILKLKNLQTEEWIASEDSFNCLEQLCIENCFNLMSIPLCLGDVPNLNLISVTGCKLSVAESVREIEKMQRESQNEELKVYIHRTLPS